MTTHHTSPDAPAPDAPAPGRLTPPLKWHGGKRYLAERIVGLMPEHHLYAELFAGGLAVLWQKNPEGVSEVVNDINGNLMTFYRVLQDEAQFARFVRRVQAVPLARASWEDAHRSLAACPEADVVERAAWFFVLNRQSLAGRMTDYTGITKTRTRGGMNAEVSAWLGAVDGLPAVHARLRRVVIESRPAIELLPKYDVAGAVMYCDPPYPACTRAAPEAYGAYEMSDADHEEFLAAVCAVEHASVIISGYRCTLYDDALRDWNRHDFDLANHAASGRSKQRKVESVWLNY